MLEVTTLASGSSGNCLLVTDGQTRLLVDPGISARRICTGLRDLGLDPGSLSGILVTHEHTDHISGLNTLTRQLQLPIYTSAGTGRELCRRAPATEGVIRPVSPGSAFSVESLEIGTFPTPHDAAESMGFTISGGGRKASVVTDLGYVTPAVADAVRGSDLLVAETNHEEDWVRTSPYPYYLKQRILGDHGHLSNAAGAQLVCMAAEHGAKAVILAHLSAENNTPSRAYDTVCAALRLAGAEVGGDITVDVAPRAETGRRICL